MSIEQLIYITKYKTSEYPKNRSHQAFLTKLNIHDLDHTDLLKSITDILQTDSSIESVVSIQATKMVARGVF